MSNKYQALRSVMHTNNEQAMTIQLVVKTAFENINLINSMQD